VLRILNLISQRRVDRERKIENVGVICFVLFSRYIPLMKVREYLENMEMKRYERDNDLEGKHRKFQHFCIRAVILNSEING